VEYKDYNENAGCDFLIASRETDRNPKLYRIEKVAERDGANGKKFPCITLRDLKGDVIQTSAWVRDVAKLCAQWGTNSDDWIGHGVYLGIKNRKMVLLPAPDTDLIPAEAVK